MVHSMFLSRARQNRPQNKWLSALVAAAYSAALVCCNTVAGVPAILHGKPEAIVLYNNLGSITATIFQCPSDNDGKALALELDQAMRENAPAGWKGDETREKQVLNALFPIMSRDRPATQAVFEIIKRQPGY